MSRNSPVFSSSKAHDCPSTFGTLLECSGDGPEADTHALGDLTQGEPVLVKPDYLLPVENLPWSMCREILAGPGVNGLAHLAAQVVLAVPRLASLNALQDQAALKLCGCPKDL